MEKMVVLQSWGQDERILARIMKNEKAEKIKAKQKKCVEAGEKNLMWEKVEHEPSYKGLVVCSCQEILFRKKVFNEKLNAWRQC